MQLGKENSGAAAKKRRSFSSGKKIGPFHLEIVVIFESNAERTETYFRCKARAQTEGEKRGRIACYAR